MTVLEDVILELKEERDAMAAHLATMPTSEKSRVLGYYEGRVKAYDQMIKVVEKYALRDQKKEKEKRK